jgi:hypothetical protein
MKFFKEANKQSGQILLITIMLLATVLTVVISISFKSTTESQITKLEEESQKALAAAEAGIEAALRTGSNVAIGTLPNLSEFSGNAELVDVTTIGTKFISPFVTNDQQYTFYLASYSAGAFSTPYSGTVTVYYGDSGTNCNTLAVEITTIAGSGNTQVKYIADTSGLTGGSGNIGSATPTTLDDGSTQTDFSCKTSAITVPADAKVMVIRPIKTGTRIGVQGNANLRPQGKTVVSEATSQTGVTKRVQLFQSFPQIPADFFVTSFNK